MSFKSEELDNYPLCGAKKKNGSTCRMFAGAGTDHKGMGRCKWHLGNSPSHRNHAAKQEAMRQMTMGSPIDVTPGQALQGVLGLSAGALAWLTAMVNALGPDELLTPEAQSLIRLQAEEKDRIARIAKAAADVGVDERQIKLQEHHTQKVGEMLAAVMDRIQLTAEQRRAVGPAIREALPALTPSPARDASPDPLDVDADEPVPA